MTTQANFAHRVVPFTGWLRTWLANNKQARAPLGQLIQEYASETGKQVGSRAAQKAIREFEAKGYIQIERKEQLWCLPMVPIEEKRTTSEPKPMVSLGVGQSPALGLPRIHSSHHYQFIQDYQGAQPVAGAVDVRPWGRKWPGKERKAFQSIFKPTWRVSITAFVNCLMIWIHQPKGQRTAEQEAMAKKDAQEAVIVFAAAHKLALTGAIRTPRASHHVVEQKALNEALTQALGPYQEAIQARIGSKICPSSHKDKWEHEGKRRADRIIFAPDVAKAVEFVFYDLNNYLDFKFQENEKEQSLLRAALDARAVELAQLAAGQSLLLKAMQELTGKASKIGEG